MLSNQRGVAHILLILFVVGCLGGIGFIVYTATSKREQQTDHASMGQDTMASASWSFDGENWTASGTPPACPDPLALPTPVNINKVTQVLYPGQSRGGNYKSHGGFLFNRSKNSDISVTLPLDAQLVRGSRYIERGELQYFFVFINPCGLMYRFDHLAKLTPKFQAIANKLPEAKVDDSRTTNIGRVEVKAGKAIATSVGFAKGTPIVAVDFGINDLRQRNTISTNAKWMAEHNDDMEYAPYGVCWLDLMTDSKQLKALPGGDSTSGKTSDYCN